MRGMESLISDNSLRCGDIELLKNKADGSGYVRCDLLI